MPDDTLIQRAREHYQTAKTAWEDIRKEAKLDLRFVSGDQWDPAVKSQRESAGRPALTFNRLHTLVQQITNQARQQRPQPKVLPADGPANPETAEMLAGHMRHIQYASQADVARDCAIEYSASCGFGYYRVTTEYVDDEGFDQEPRVRRILDPMTVYFDPECQEPDFSDADWCLVRQRMTREEYRKRFGKEAVAFDSGDEGMSDWATEEHVWVAEYWHVETKMRRLVQLIDGTRGYADEFEIPISDELIANEREVEERAVKFDLIDGARVLESTEWLGQWIPIIPVLGREMVIDGKRQLISIVRFARDPQKLLNAYKSGIAENIALSTRAPWIGVKGQFKDAKWADATTRNYSYLEVEPITISGSPAPMPQRNMFEAPIAALSSAALQEADDIKAAAGYQDSILQPSKADISGIAVQRRSQQADLTNFHFEDNLARSLWHEGRILLDLIIKLYDVPRSIRTMKEDGTIGLAAITQAGEDGMIQAVQGKETEPHHRLDLGRYDVTISTGPSYNTKREEERDILLQMASTNPAAWSVYGDLIFKAMGYADLEQRAKFALAPPIQQAIQQSEQGEGKPPIPPALQAQMAQMAQQLQMLQAQLRAELMDKKARILESQTKIQVEIIRQQGNVAVEEAKLQHDKQLALFEAEMQSIENRLAMLHESEMAPEPQPQGGTVQ